MASQVASWQSATEEECEEQHSVDYVLVPVGIQAANTPLFERQALTLQVMLQWSVWLNVRLDKLMRMHRLTYARLVDKAEIRGSKKSAAFDSRDRMFVMTFAMHWDHMQMGECGKAKQHMTLQLLQLTGANKSLSA